MLKKIKKYLLVMKTSIQNNLAYSVNFIFGSLFFAFAIFIFLQLWETVYGKDEAFAGYTVNQIVWYYIIAELVVLSRSDVFNSLNQDVKDGNIAYLLNRPYDYILFQFSDSTGQIASKLIVNTAFGIAIGFLYVGPLKDFRIYNLPFMLTAVAMGSLLNFFIHAAIGLTAFWTEDNAAFYWIVQKLTFMFGVFLPVEFLPGWLQGIALSLPFSYVAYGPARLVAAFSFEKYLQVVVMQVLYLVLFIAATYYMYAKGVRKLNVNGG